MTRSVIQFVAQDKRGDIVPGAAVEIRDADSGALVQVWNSRTGGSLVGNPGTTDSSGLFRGYINPGRVNVSASKGTFSRAWNDVVADDSIFPHISVKDFGAKGDGVADDSPAFEAAVAAIAARGGGTIYFPPGVYELGDIALTMVSNLTLAGDGASSVLQNFRHVQSAGSGAAAVGLSNVHWRDLRILGYRYVWDGCENLEFSRVLFENTGGGASRFAQFTNCARVTVRGCRVLDCQYGVWIGGPVGSEASQNQDFWIVDNTFTTVTPYSFPAAVNIADGANIHIVGNRISGFQPSSGNGYGVYQGDNLTFKAENILVSGNKISGCQNGVRVHNASRVIITDNLIESSALSIANFGDLDPVDGSTPHTAVITGNVCNNDISWCGNYQDVLIQGNSLSGGNRGINTYTTSAGKFAENVRVLGNSVRGARKTGIMLRGVRRALVADNQIEDCNTDENGAAYETAGISVYVECGDVRISGNHVSNSGAGKLLRGVYVNSTSAHDTARIFIAQDNTFFNLGTRVAGYYSAAPTAGTWEVGESHYVPAPIAGGSIGIVCVQRGTAGSLAGCTADGSSGTNTLVVNTSADLRVGQQISIAGVSGTFRVVSIMGLTVTLSANIDATVSGAAVSFSAPIWKTFGAIVS